MDKTNTEQRLYFSAFGPDGKGYLPDDNGTVTNDIRGEAASTAQMSADAGDKDKDWSGWQIHVTTEPNGNGEVVQEFSFQELGVGLDISEITWDAATPEEARELVQAAGLVGEENLRKAEGIWFRDELAHNTADVRALFPTFGEGSTATDPHDFMAKDFAAIKSGELSCREASGRWKEWGLRRHEADEVIREIVHGPAHTDDRFNPSSDIEALRDQVYGEMTGDFESDVERLEGFIHEKLYAPMVEKIVKGWVEYEADCGQSFSAEEFIEYNLNASSAEDERLSGIFGYDSRDVRNDLAAEAKKHDLDFRAPEDIPLIEHLSEETLAQVRSMLDQNHGQSPDDWIDADVLAETVLEGVIENYRNCGGDLVWDESDMIALYLNGDHENLPESVQDEVSNALSEKLQAYRVQAVEDRMCDPVIDYMNGNSDIAELVQRIKYTVEVTGIDFKEVAKHVPQAEGKIGEHLSWARRCHGPYTGTPLIITPRGDAINTNHLGAFVAEDWKPVKEDIEYQLSDLREMLAAGLNGGQQQLPADEDLLSKHPELASAVNGYNSGTIGISELAACVNETMEKTVLSPNQLSGCLPQAGGKVGDSMMWAHKHWGREYGSGDVLLVTPRGDAILAPKNNLKVLCESWDSVKTEMECEVSGLQAYLAASEPDARPEPGEIEAMRAEPAGSIRIS